jgi:hypothetical protein
MSTDKPVDIFEPVISTMRAQIEEWQRMIERLEWMRTNGIVGASSPGPLPAVPAQNGASAFSNDSFFGLTIAEAAKKYLSATKRTATARSIADALIAGGLKSAAKNPVENVRSTLSRMPAFVVIHGEFGLTEWYPGRKSASKQRPGSPQSSSAGERVEGADDTFDPSKNQG